MKKRLLYTVVCLFLFITNILGVILGPNELRFEQGSGWHQTADTIYLNPTGNITGNEITIFGNELLRVINNKNITTEGDLWLSQDWYFKDDTDDNLYASPNFVLEGRQYYAILTVTSGFTTGPRTPSDCVMIEGEIKGVSKGCSMNNSYILPGTVWAGFTHKALKPRIFLSLNPDIYTLKQNQTGSETYINLVDESETSSINFIIAGQTTKPAISIFGDGFVGIGITNSVRPDNVENTKLKVWSPMTVKNGALFLKKETNVSGYYGIKKDGDSDKLNIFSKDSIIFVKKTGSHSYSNMVMHIDNNVNRVFFNTKTAVLNGKWDIRSKSFAALATQLPASVILLTTGDLILGKSSSGTSNTHLGQYGTKLFLRGTEDSIVVDKKVWIARFNKLDNVTELRMCVGDSADDVVSIGYDTNPSGAPAFTATHYFTGDGQTLRLSDRRLKTNIKNIENASEILNQLIPVKYYLRNQLPKGPKKLGLIAQQVETVLPEIIFDTGGIKSINYKSIIPILIQGLKEQNKKIEDYKAEYKILKKEIDKLKKSN
jgi:hypothetical protein